MKRFGHLFDRFHAPSNLWRAWRDFRRGKRKRSTVRAFELDAQRHVLRLRRELASDSYEPRGYRLKLLLEPKRRLIAAAPVRDRVVHHAVHRVLAPLLDRRLVDTTFACRKGYGNHSAVLAFQAALRRFKYVLLLDVRHYFLSIDRTILLALMASRIKDGRMLDVLRTILDSGEGLYRVHGVPELLGLAPDFPPPGCGLPIGNLTSQWWGNHYLDGLDHFVKRELKIPHWQRYMDDLACFSDSPATLSRAESAIARWLLGERRLTLKRPGAEPRPTGGTFTYLGYRVSRAAIRPTEEVLRRMQTRVTAVVLGGSPERIQRSVASYRGVVGFGTPGSSECHLRDTRLSLR